MSNDVDKFRSNFFDYCRDTSLETDQLASTLKISAKKEPIIFDDHIPVDFIKNKSQWSAGYFEQCISEAKEVFSLERLEHLLAVREYLRKMGTVGFKANYPKNTFHQMPSNEFQPSENLVSHFQNIGTDPLKAQIALGIEIYSIDKSSDYLIKVVNWAESKSPNIFQNYETSALKKAISTNKNDWDTDYFDIQTECLSRNFSKERYLHLIEVRQYLRDKGVEGFVPLAQKKTVSTTKTEQPKQAGQEASKSGSTPQSMPNSDPHAMSSALRTALMIGGAIAALLVLVFSITR